MRHEAKSDICTRLQLETVKQIRRLQFLLLEYEFFKDSEEGSALSFSLPWLFSPFSLMLHIVESRAFTLLRLPCYFVKFKGKIVGLFAIEAHRQSLLVASLGVAKEYRRVGIGTYILAYIEKIAERMGKGLLEVDVLTKNIPAQRLYIKHGFTFTSDERTHGMMRGRKWL